MKFNKTYLFIIITVLLLLSALAYFFYRQGKKQVTLQSLPGQLPGESGNNVSGASNDELKNIANDLFSDMNGFNFFGHNYDPYQRAVLLNDTDLVRLYNAWNKLYQSKVGETLTTMIGNERYSEPNVPGVLLMRLKKLNSL